jgi:hypothetical protein
MVKVFAGDLAATVGCFTFAGACPFEVLFAQPGTDVGRSAEFAGATVTNPSRQLANSAIVTFLYIVELLIPIQLCQVAYL